MDRRSSVSIYAVNGKTPIAAWIPSLDDAGNGTTTLNDLVGSNNGTLTNFALTGATSNWVSDTGSGGVRALDFDGVNDFVTTSSGTVAEGRTTFSAMAWVKSSSTAGLKQIFARYQTTTNNRAWSMLTANTAFSGSPTGKELGVVITRDGDFSGPYKAYWTPGVFISDGDWHLAGFTWDEGVLRLYVDGVERSTTKTRDDSFTTVKDASGVPISLGAINPSTGGLEFFPGRLDDCRLFNVALSAADVDYLWGGGTGRGVIDVAGNPIAFRKRLLRMRSWR
jgi:hypothetical protein